MTLDSIFQNVSPVVMTICAENLYRGYCNLDMTKNIKLILAVELTILLQECLEASLIPCSNVKLVITLKSNRVSKIKLFKERFQYRRYQHLIIQIPEESGFSFSSLSINCSPQLAIIYPYASAVFRNRYGLPIQVSAKIIAKVEAKCKHGVYNSLSVAIIPSKIEWLILGKKESSGAFKLGHSDQAEYHSRDLGECVIYHPPLELTKSPKQVEIEVKLKHPLGVMKYKIYIHLHLQKGLGKGLSTLANVKLETIDQANTSPALTSFVENKKCEICRPQLLFDKQESTIVLAGTIYDSRYLMTSEYIKMMISRSTNKKEQICFTCTEGRQVLLDGLSPDDDDDIKWQCSAGKFVGSHIGRSVIYLTPNEAELSKSPVTIAVQRDGMTIASRRFWLLRGSSVMHC